MTQTYNLLRQVFGAIKTVSGVTDNAEFKALLGPAELVLNELMLQQSSAFYLDHLAAGASLLTDGRGPARAEATPLPTAETQSRSHASAASADVIADSLEVLAQQLVTVLQALDENRSAEEKDYIARVCDWQVARYRHSLTPAWTDTARDAIDAERLLAYLKRRFPQSEDLVVERVVSLAGGFSKKTILFETRDAEHGPQSFVMRAEQPVNLLCMDGSDVAREFPMIQLMQAAGLPVAEPLWLETDTAHLGTRFIVSRKAAGKIYGSSIGSEEALSSRMIERLIDTLIKIHAIRIEPADPRVCQSHLAEWLPFATVRECTRYAVTTYFRTLMRRCNVAMTPDLLRVLKWLERNVPDSDEAPVVIHFDFALNNLLIEDDRLVAVLDWESSRLADPAEDLIWTQQNLATYISMPELLRRYEAATGKHISEFRLAYARVLRCALNTLCCLSAQRALTTEHQAHIYLAILAYQYLPIFGAQSNELIEAAERVRC